MTVMSRVMVNSTATGGSLLRTFPDPSTRWTDSRRNDAWVSAYAYRWAFYNSTAFDRLNTSWSIYRAYNRLYRHTRVIYNPYPLLVDFYAGAVYPGFLPARKEDIPEGVDPAIPLAASTPPEVERALYQAWDWSRWGIRKNLMVRYGAALGDCLVEIIDDEKSQKVYTDIVWPGFCPDFGMNRQGELEWYVIEYQYIDQADNRKYMYRKEVTLDSFSTYRDGKPYGYGDMPAKWENPYGFIPAVWIKHKEVGAIRGAPSMRNPDVWEVLNGLVSHMVDRAHQTLAAPPLIAGEGVGRLGGTTQVKSVQTDEMPNTTPSYDESINFLRGSTGATIAEVPMDYKGGIDLVDKIIGVVEALHPEVMVYRELRSMERMSGPAAERMFGDVEVHLSDAKAVYDEATARLFQKVIAIAGMRSNSTWEDTGENEAFKPFDIGAYSRGDARFTILPRPLLPLTQQEKLQNELLRQAVERNEGTASMSVPGN